MGSIGQFRPKGIKDKEFFETEYPSMKVLATSRVSGVIYAAFEKEDGEVFAFVSPYSTSRGEFIYKMQDETMGPCDVRCPAKVLDLLSETTDVYAMEWRAKCRAYLQGAEVAKRLAKAVVAGTKIRITTGEVSFGKRYGSFTEFIYSGKGSGFTALRDGVPTLLVSLTSWKEMNYEVVS